MAEKGRKRREESGELDGPFLLPLGLLLVSKSALLTHLLAGEYLHPALLLDNDVPMKPRP